MAACSAAAFSSAAFASAAAASAAAFWAFTLRSMREARSAFHASASIRPRFAKMSLQVSLAWAPTLSQCFTRSSFTLSRLDSSVSIGLYHPRFSMNLPSRWSR